MYSIAEPTAPFILATCAVLLMNCKCTLDNIQLQIQVVLKQQSSREFVLTRDVRGLAHVCIYVSNKTHSLERVVILERAIYYV